MSHLGFLAESVDVSRPILQVESDEVIPRYLNHLAIFHLANMGEGECLE